MISQLGCDELQCSIHLYLQYLSLVSCLYCDVTHAEFLSFPVFLLLGVSSKVVPRLCEWCSRAITAGVPQLALRQSQQREQTHRCFMVLTDFGRFSLLFLQMSIVSYTWSLYVRMGANVCALEIQ